MIQCRPLGWLACICVHRSTPRRARLCRPAQRVVVRLHDDDGGGGGAGAGAGRDDGGRPPGSGLLSAAAAAAVNRGWYSAARSACSASMSSLMLAAAALGAAVGQADGGGAAPSPPSCYDTPVLVDTQIVGADPARQGWSSSGGWVHAGSTKACQHQCCGTVDCVVWSFKAQSCKLYSQRGVLAGAPVSWARWDGRTSFRRQFAHLNVSVDCATRRATFSWDADDDELKLKTDDSAATAVVHVGALQRQEEIVDAHVHLANTNLVYTGAKPAHNWSLADYTADTQSSALPPTAIVMVCLTEAAGQTAAMLAQVRWVQSLEPLAGQPKIAAIVAQAPLERGRAVGSFLDELLHVAPKVRGVRLVLSESPSLVPAPSELAAAMVQLASRNMTMDVLAKAKQLHRVVEIAQMAPPDIKINLNHLGGPPFTSNATAKHQWSVQIRALGELSNVFCKISGTPPEPWTDADVAPFVREVVAAFGFSRVMFAGNWFVVAKHSSFAHWAEAVDSILLNTSVTRSAERARLLSRTAHEVYALPPALS
jgi:L-fuconolactonase